MSVSISTSDCEPAWEEEEEGETHRGKHVVTFLKPTARRRIGLYGLNRNRPAVTFSHFCWEFGCVSNLHFVLVILQRVDQCTVCSNRAAMYNIIFNQNPATSFRPKGLNPMLLSPLESLGAPRNVVQQYDHNVRMRLHYAHLVGLADPTGALFCGRVCITR